jgi:cytosine/adenosine deaminase-related metal-dependent hydrolase
MKGQPSRILIGSIVHSLAFGEIQIIDNGAIVYDQNGEILELLDLSKTPLSSEITSSVKEIDDWTGKLIIPGFIDAHCHAPQYVFSGTGMDLPLLLWLEKYTFPCEAKFENEEFARKAYEKSIKRHLKCGTTFASYFATIHTSACKVLVDVIQQMGQRAFVGKVSMDRNAPDFYIEETEKGGRDVEEFIQYCFEQTDVGRQFLQSLSGINMKQANETISSSVNKKPKLETSDNFLPVSAEKQSNSFITPRTLRAVTMDGHDDMIDGGVTLPSQITPSMKTDGFVFPESALLPENRKRTVSDMSSLVGTGTKNISPSRSLSSSPTAVAFSSSSNLPPSLLNRADTPLVMPCITPRFVPTCSSEIMQKLGDLAKKYALPVQSHMSESLNEIEWVKSLHPECSTYASVYELYGLLCGAIAGSEETGEPARGVSYMAHCCHSNKEERDIMKRNCASVVHCASSNFMLSSGVADIRLFLEEGVKVALGTDVAGGYSPSMLDAIRQCVIASRVKGFDYRLAASTAAAIAATKAAEAPSPSSLTGDDNEDPIMICGSCSNELGDEATIDDSLSSTSDLSPDSSITKTSSGDPLNEHYKAISYLEAFHLATVGGAEVMGMGDVLGNFIPGKKVDCLIVDVNTDNTPIDIFEHESIFEHFQKFLFLGDDRNIIHVYVDGKMVL